MSWSLRLLVEARYHTYARFLTLTYAETFRPPVLQKRDIQLFLKRLRKGFPASIRFFCCGEYGTRTNRPHWHLIIYTSRLPDRLSLGLITLKEWPFGFTHVGELNVKSAMYAAKYSLKSYADGQRSCVTMSRRPGLGKEYFVWLGGYYAERFAELPAVPNRISVEGKVLPMDRFCKEVFTDAYLRAGGAINVGLSDVTHHLVAVHHSVYGTYDNIALNEVLWKKSLINGA